MIICDRCGKPAAARIFAVVATFLDLTHKVANKGIERTALFGNNNPAEDSGVVADLCSGCLDALRLQVNYHLTEKLPKQAKEHTA